MKTLICDCNQTMTLDAPALRQALTKTPGASPDGLERVHTLLCRREAGDFQRAAKSTGQSGEALLVACTQEQALFQALNEETVGAASITERPLRFVNIRETAGWSGAAPSGRGRMGSGLASASAVTPKIAALIAAAQGPEPTPVPSVQYRSGGRCLIIGAASTATRAAQQLASHLELALLIDRNGGALAPTREHVVRHGKLTDLRGWLGQFSATWTEDHPIDLELCTRCNACLEACPEGAIGLDYRVDTARCQQHRSCVQVCASAGAIDFGRQARSVVEAFDLVLDLGEEPAIARHQPPQGYFHAPDEASLSNAILALRELKGEFEKPKFFQYESRLCAHSRNEQIGCRACLDVCSAQAIHSNASRKGKSRLEAQAAGGVVVEPHLCVGCGACSTVCPSSAMRFNYPSAIELGQRIHRLLQAYANADGRDPVVLLHSAGEGRAHLEALGRAARLPQRGEAARGVNAAPRGLPARVVPVSVWHTASVGIENWLTAIAQGANAVWILLTDEEAPAYRDALRAQCAVAQAILHGLGYGGEHLRLIDTSMPGALEGLANALRRAPTTGVARPARFEVQANKRTTLELAIDHLQAQSPLNQRPDAVALPAQGSPLGGLQVDVNRCTVCLSCVGACPSGALLDNPEKPELRLIEKNCVQCGLCASTCPEQAITLIPRLLLADEGRTRSQPQVLARTEPWRCIRCSKPFGTLQAVQAIVNKLAGHGAFQGGAAERIKMCNDCRVIDLYSDGTEVRITDL